MLSLKLPRLMEIHEVPKDFWEESIISGYRSPRSSITDCILSLFQLNNETLNIWTHFLAAWYFLWRLFVFTQTNDVWRDSYTWPAMAYMVTCCGYPLASSFAHTFSTMSVFTRHICFFIDYAALSLYSLGSGIAYSAYIFPDKWVSSSLHHVYVPFSVCNSLISVTLACWSRLTEPGSPKLSKAVRILAFTYPYLYDSIPLLYRMFLCSGKGCTYNQTVPSHCVHLLLAAVTVTLFTLHLPERLAPGRFDYVGHSHQLFHLSSVLATITQLEAILMDMQLRRGHKATLGRISPSVASSWGALVMGIVLNLIAITAFSLHLLTFLQSPCGIIRYKNKVKQG
uniref:membrane progestin receptor gamma-B-like n=1 Tax=Myxine glutinosa TaxID=7769 RepID=UPI00358E80FF